MKTTVRWVYKSFEALSAHELYSILQLRSLVFVVEQNCVYQDVDGKDEKSMHLCGYIGQQLVAYARLLPQGVSYIDASIGRVVSHPYYRGKAIGKELMEKAIASAIQSFGTTVIRISAQLYIKKFYESLGFVQVSDPYMEDDIPHIEMLFHHNPTNI